jgi:hypothetical protein
VGCTTGSREEVPGGSKPVIRGDDDDDDDDDTNPVQETIVRYQQNNKFTKFYEFYNIVYLKIPLFSGSFFLLANTTPSYFEVIRLEILTYFVE